MLLYSVLLGQNRLKSAGERLAADRTQPLLDHLATGVYEEKVGLHPERTRL